MVCFRLLAVVCVVAGSFAGHAATGEDFARDDALEISQAAIGRLLDDYSLRDIDGQPFDLAQLRGKPLVISLIYTSCHHICPTITRNLGDTIDVAQEALGEGCFLRRHDRLRLEGGHAGAHAPVCVRSWYG